MSDSPSRIMCSLSFLVALSRRTWPNEAHTEDSVRRRFAHCYDQGIGCYVLSRNPPMCATRLPPLTAFLPALNPNELIKHGVVSRFTKHEWELACPGGCPSLYAWASAEGRLQACYDSTALAIRFWVPRGASLREMMDASGGRCDPAALAEAINARLIAPKIPLAPPQAPI